MTRASEATIRIAMVGLVAVGGCWSSPAPVDGERDDATSTNSAPPDTTPEDTSTSDAETSKPDAPSSPRPETSRRAKSETGPQKQSAERCVCPDRPGSFAEPVQEVRPAVVNIFRRGEDGENEGENGPDEFDQSDNVGSGIIVDERGHIVTNHHVIREHERLRVELQDGRRFAVEPSGTDSNTDVALLKARTNGETNLPTAPLGSSHTLSVGDWVVAIGNPLGLASTVTAGIISGLGRSNLPMHKEVTYQDFIQTDASINPGNSGGPLVNTEGKVIGLNAAKSEAGHGINFAIPIEMVQRVLPELMEDGEVERSWIGIYVDRVSKEVRDELDLPPRRGVLVTGTVDDGPADRAGIREGDVILSMDGSPIGGLAHITWLAGSLGVGRDVSVVVKRGEKRRTFELTLHPHPNVRQNND